MKKALGLIGLLGLIGVMALKLHSCAVPQSIQSKPGALLWADNCIRCHNVPTPSEYNDRDWDLVATHMQLKANLTTEETEKILDFLQMAN